MISAVGFFMAHAWTYSTLRQALQDWTEDDNAEFLAQIDTIIALGETKLVRDLDLEIFDETRTGAFAVGKLRQDKPDGYLAMRSLHYTDYDGGIEYIEQRGYDVVRDLASDPYALGKPRYWCELTEGLWGVAPYPEACFCWEARILVRPPGLSAEAPTSWLAEHAPDALLYACLLNCEEYLKDDARASVWRNRYNTEVVPMARVELRNMLRDQYRPQGSVEGKG